MLADGETSAIDDAVVLCFSYRPSLPVSVGRGRRALTWLVYTAYFLFSGRPKAELFLRVLGVIFVIFTLTWVNFSRFFVGIHSYAMS